MTCGVLFSNDGAGPHDKDGCRLPVGHQGPHEFLAAYGTVYQWETDWACTCSSCMSPDPDFCSIYWPVTEKSK